MNWKKIINFLAAGAIGFLTSLFPLMTEAQLLRHPYSNVIKLSSTLWSDLRDVKFRESKAFCVFYDGLTIMDLSDVNSPLEISQVELSPNGHKADVAGNYAYVIAKDSSLYLVDISSINHPILINSFKTTDAPMDIKVRDNCAYLAARNAGLLVVDVFDPLSISLIGSCNVPDFSALSLDIHGNLAYLVGTEGLRLINIVVPYYPFLFGSYDAVTGARKVFVHADSERIYTYVGSSEELWILDATNPKDILPISSYTSTSPIADLSISDDYAYLGLTYQGLQVLDTRDKTSPKKISALRLGDYTREVFPFPDFVFVTDNFAPTKIINVFNPDRPFLSGRWIIPGSPKDVVVKENFAYVLCDLSGLHILNVADPIHPQMVSTLYTPYNNNGIDIEGDYAFITALLTGMQVVSLSDPYHPEVVARYKPEGYTYGVEVKDGYAYLLNAENDIQIIDIHNPFSLIPRGSAKTPGAAQEIAVQGEYLYVADLSAGLTIVNAADKDHPFIIKSIPTVGRCKDVFTSGNLLFLACEDAGMEIYNVTDPEAPSFVGLYSSLEEIKDLHVENNYAYLTMENHKIEVVDISSLSSPNLVTSYDLLDNPGNLMVRNCYIYLCDGRSFKILRFLPPALLPSARPVKM